MKYNSPRLYSPKRAKNKVCACRQGSAILGACRNGIDPGGAKPCKMGATPKP